MWNNKKISKFNFTIQCYNGLILQRINLLIFCSQIYKIKIEKDKAASSLIIMNNKHKLKINNKMMIEMNKIK